MLKCKNTNKDTIEWYKKYYEVKGDNRNSLLRNPEVLFQTLACDASIIKGLFCVNSKTMIKGIFRGAIIPPIGRIISKRFSCLYFLLQYLFPFLVGQVTYVLQKK
ncbi:MAG: hypothetical protein HRU72_06590 [Planctomycetia bacterium]|nr:hypothetical protein [Candidatus Brocadia sp.]QOJ06243.1 MAG: hypothetical protein HRU72_06590 [Planctomycetia bacterium]TVL94801.1 MAG: hypothetical protein CV082_13500 [Candidatus Brocadia sp. BL1]HQU32183.1 hypothetical protein [Candidatus Brocadia sapporoensis]